MKKYRWMKVLAVGLITLVTVVGTAESGAQQKFKFGDLFKKTKKTETKSTESSEKAADAEKKTDEANTPASTETTKSAATTDSSASKSKGTSNADRLKELTDKLNLSGTDPDALVRSARARMRAMQGKEDSSKITSSTTAKKAEPKEKPKEVVKAKPVPVAPPTKTVKTTVTAGAVESTPKAPVAVTSRPPSLAPVSAVAAASVAIQKESPPENLQASLLAASGVPLPKPLVPEKLKKKNKSEEGGLEITSDEAETDLVANTVIFIGDVELKEPTFNLRCDRLVVFMNDKGDNSDSQFKEAVATGAMVIVERINGDGEKDVGHSRKVVYDARTGDIVLSGGPPVLNSGGGTVKTTHPDATIVLKKDGNHRVKQRGVFIIPVKGKMGETRKGPSLLPSKLGDISNRK